MRWIHTESNETIWIWLRSSQQMALTNTSNRLLPGAVSGYRSMCPNNSGRAGADPACIHPCAEEDGQRPAKFAGLSVTGE